MIDAAFHVGNRSISVECVADVSPVPGKIRIDVSHCGICGTDLHAYHGKWINVLANAASMDTKCPRSSIACHFRVYQRSWVAAEANAVYIPGYKLETAVTTAAQQRANRNYRARLEQRGFKRFEVMALETDRELLRTLARRLAEDGPEADRARTAVRELVADEPPKPGVILSALRRSPLVGADLDLSRARVDGRRVDL